jgi:hypothetical protein
LDGEGRRGWRRKRSSKDHLFFKGQDKEKDVHGMRERLFFKLGCGLKRQERVLFGVFGLTVLFFWGEDKEGDIEGRHQRALGADLFGLRKDIRGFELANRGEGVRGFDGDGWGLFGWCTFGG